MALAVLLFVAPGVVVMMLITGHYFMATLGSEFWQSAGIAAAWWVAVAVSASARSAPFAALVVAASTVVALIAFSNASPSTTTASANSPKSHRVATTAPGCRLYMAGANVRIAVSEQKRCAAVTRHLRAWTGEHWIHRFHSTDDTLTSACELRKGALRVRVFDSGFQTYGDEACHALRHHGFTRIGT